MLPGTLQALTPRGLPRRLHDPDPQVHPLGTWLLQMGVDSWIRCMYRRIVVSPKPLRIGPGTLLASNHQRDVDGPMLGVTLLHRRGLRFQGTPPWYATREDLFRPGILARLMVDWPAPLPALLGRIPLAWFFPLGRTEPIRRVREFSLGETLHALRDAGCGRLACASVLNRRGLRELALHDASAPLDTALARSDPRLEQWWGLRRLRRSSRRRLAPVFRATVDAQLEHFARRLDRGCCLYFSPEGAISMDGHFGRIRGGFQQLVRRAAQPPWVQPVAMAYDTLGFGRPRVLIHFGERFRADPALDRRHFDATLRKTILGILPITPSHLLSRWLAHGEARFSGAQFAKWLDHQVEGLQARHAVLDPLLAHDRRALVRDRLRWLELKGLVVRAGTAYRNTLAPKVPPGWHSPAATVRYLDNQLADATPPGARGTPC